MPAPKAYAPILRGWIIPPKKLGICTDSFFNNPKKGHPPLSTKGKQTLDRKIREAVAFYACQMSLPKTAVLAGTHQTLDPRSFVTLTEQRKSIHRLVMAARKVQQNYGPPSSLKGLSQSLLEMETIYRELDISTSLLIKKTLHVLDSDIFQMIAELHIERHQRPSRAALDLLENLVSFVAQQPKGRRWANPALVDLVVSLIPVWHEATGRAHQRTNSGPDKGSKNSDAKSYLFAEALIQVLKPMGCKFIPSHDQVNKIARRFGLKNRVPHR